MTTTGVTVGGVPAISVVVHVPSIGAWWADCTMGNADPIDGRTTIAIGDSLTLSGTVVATRAGVFAEQRILRVVGGGGAWASMLAARGYHNDGGVSVLGVATDAATEAGETIGTTFVPASDLLAVDYVRSIGPASRTLEEIIGESSWWVAFDGTTNVGTRSTSTADPSTYELLEFDPLNRVVTLAMDDLSSVSIGMTLPAETRMPVAQTIREIRYEISGNDALVIVSCGETDVRGRIISAIRSISKRSSDDRYYGIAKYRVINVSGDRLMLQAITDGVPNIGPISMAPGVAGASSVVSEGSTVLVQFIEGKRSLPIVTHFAGKDGEGFVPVSTVIDVTTGLKLGANATKHVAWREAILTELQSIANAFATFVPGSGGASFPHPYVAPLSDSGLGAAKVTAE